MPFATLQRLLRPDWTDWHCDLFRGIQSASYVAGTIGWNVHIYNKFLWSGTAYDNSEVQRHTAVWFGDCIGSDQRV